MPEIQHGYVMSDDEIKTLTGQTVPTDVLGVHPTGNLIHVLLEEVPEKYATIVIPQTERDKERMGIGYIIAVGHMAGHPDFAKASPSPIGVIATGETSECLLGLHVVFGALTGMPLRMSILDREFKSSVVIMVSKDIKGVDTNPIPLKTRLEDRWNSKNTPAVKDPKPQEDPSPESAGGLPLGGKVTIKIPGPPLPTDNLK